jgi:hypothetical protein
VPGVPRVLLDHVDDHLAQRDRGAVPHGATDAQVVSVRDETLGEADLVSPVLPRVGHHRGIGHRVGPVGIIFFVGPVMRWGLLTRHDPPEPVPLHVGHVPDQAQ